MSDPNDDDFRRRVGAGALRAGAASGMTTTKRLSFPTKIWR